jgi:hypothetical protein
MVPGAENRKTVLWIAVIVILLCGTNPGLLQAEEPKVVDLRSGAWELGFNGSVVSRESAVGSMLAVFTNNFRVIHGVTVSAGAAAGWSHVSDLDRVDLGIVAAAYRRLSDINAWIYAGPGGGLRQEWVGSFKVVRYPLGVDLGLKSLFSTRAAITVAYQYRRLLNDPVANFDEHRFVTGISILLNNGRDKTR